MKTRLFLICTSPYLETVVYYFMIFVLEMFFEESGSVASKITTKPIIRRQLSKFNQVSDREIFYFILFSLFFFFVSFFFFPTHSHPEFLALFAGSSNLQTTNQMNEKFVYRLQRVVLTTKKKRFYLCAIADRRSPWLLVL